MIRAILRTINGIWAWDWAWSPIGLLGRAIDAIVDRTSPPLDGR